MIFCLFIRLITFIVAFSHDFEHFLFAHAYFIRLIRFLCSACFVNRTTTNKTAKTLILPKGYEAVGEVDIKKYSQLLKHMQIRWLLQDKKLNTFSASASR